MLSRSAPRCRSFHPLAVIVCLILSGTAFASPPVPTLIPSDTDPDEQILVKIVGREFRPSTITLHAGRTTTLVFENQDAELHAFVPIGLFTGVNLNISGNGAPEFGHDGFKRVIIPSEGRVDLRFVPEHPGTYPFFCDMPGHEMRATIIVR